MHGISDINIIGIDQTRPPFIRKEPYIDIFFELSHQAPSDWCKDINTLFAQNHPTKNANIDDKEGLFIKSWARTAADISPLLEQLKEEIQECNRQYIERFQLQHPDGTPSEAAISSEQLNLNAVIASLVFD